MNLGVQSTAKAAKVVTSVVPTGGQSDITDHGGMTADDIAEMEKEEEEEEQEEQEELKRTEFSPYTQLAAASTLPHLCAILSKAAPHHRLAMPPANFQMKKPRWARRSALT